MNKKDSIKHKLILKRLDQVYCRLAPSTIHGVGIFAIKTIPLGTNPFNNSYMAQGAIIVKKDQIKDMNIVNMLHDYHPGFPEDISQIISEFPNQPIWTNYINYSDTPNIQLMEDGEWLTLRQIEVGEELVEDPRRLFNEDGTHKVFHVKLGQYPNLNY